LKQSHVQTLSIGKRYELLFQPNTFLRLKSYSTVGINITQDILRGGCLVGFTPRVCVCPHARNLCMCVMRWSQKK